MHKTVKEAKDLASGLQDALADVESIDMAVCPTATALHAVSKVLEGSDIGVGAQNMYWEDAGAYTGEISPPMVKELADFVIIGHSERRKYFGETDETVNKKIKAALGHGLKPIVCIGESLEQNEAGETVDFVSGQIAGAFADLSAEDAKKITLAYEPIWAIGTGRTATPEDADGIIREAIRDVLTEMYDEETAEAIRVQYGGSVKPHNIADFIVMQEIDGALVGGASLTVDAFSGIIHNAIDALNN
jgi:triosephosphate isomerase